MNTLRLSLIGFTVGAALAAFLSGCTQSDRDVTDALAGYGFTDIHTQGYAPFACADKDDEFATRFTATNLQGAHVTGVVCAGILKGSTLRGLKVVR